ncbi:MAG: hypothetical protein KTR29_04575 [Rhodothermaceae bacterium]|nr:hypothetical protein [Rhodothermaceae bacterium]
MNRYLVRKILASACMLCFVLAGLHSQAVAQDTRTLNVGSMLYTTNSAFTADDINWPRAQPDSDLRMMDTYGILVGVQRDWSDAAGVAFNRQVAQVAQHKYSELENVTVPVSDGFSRTYRTPYPDKILDGVDRTDILGGGDPVSSSIPADVMIKTAVTAWPDGMNILIERWAYAFANDAYDDMVILEHVFTNQSNETWEGVYFGTTADPNAHAFYPADLWGNYYGATYRNFAAGDMSADSLRLWYSWDADQTSAFPSIDTRAEPDGIWGNFREPQHMGYMVLHADASPSDETDDPAQPWKAGWSQRELSPNLNEETHEGMYKFLAEGWDPSNPGAYAETVDGDGNVLPGKDGPYRRVSPGIDLNDGTFDPVTEQEKTVLFSFGPYTLAPGEDVRIVTAFVSGQIPHRTAIDAGAAYSNGNSTQRPLVPLPDDIVNPVTGETVASAGSTLDKAAKNAVLDIGRDLVFETAGLANRVWQNAAVKEGDGSFNIPLAPATPSLTGFSENDQIRLQWGQEATMDQDGGTVTGYRIYREFNRPSSVTSPTDTTFLLLTEINDPNTFEYVDLSVNRGEDYYYYITSVNADGVESSPYLNRTGTTSEKEIEALTPTRSPDPNWKDNIVVVPNPYHAAGADKYPGRRLVFLNLPAFANIRIYTMTGDLIQQVEHRESTGDNDWQFQDTFSSTEIVSGVYIAVIEETDASGSSTGEQAIVKFVVIK